MALIVYIDSENAVREPLSLLLEAGGYKVLQAVTGPYGVDMCREFSPDVIVTTLTPIDAEHLGPDFLAVLQEASPGTPIVTVGSDRDWTERTRAQRSGAALHLTKPLSFTDLAYAVRSLQPERARIEDPGWSHLPVETA